jgi:uncharacterized protein with HEPN domain
MYRDAGLYIVDIFIAIDKIERYTKNIKTLDEFIADEIVWDAVIRELIIIGEAIKFLIHSKLLDEKFRKIVDFRNIIVHGYFGVDEEIVWEVVKDKLNPLKSELINFINKNKLNITDAINEAIIDFKHQQKTVEFLEKLKKEI